MFAKLAIALSTLAVLATAIPTPGGAPSSTTTVSQCNTGPVQCCNTIGQFNDPAIASATGLLGIALSPIDALVGLGCLPINALAITSASCQQQPVCCQGNKQNGLVNIQCSPINL